MEKSELKGSVVAIRGRFTLFRGQLSQGDSRTHYATGPCLDGKVAPIAAFTNQGAGLEWLKARVMDEGDRPALRSA